MVSAPQNYLAVIKVVGIGGGGVNAVNRMIDAGLKGVEFIAVNTDAQALLMSDADIKLDIGRETHPGPRRRQRPRGRPQGRRGAPRGDRGGRSRAPTWCSSPPARAAAPAPARRPVIAEIAKGLGALTIGVVTRPFAFEGRRRSVQAEQGIQKLKEKVDTLIVIPNDRLLTVSNEKTSMLNAFKMADEVLLQGVSGHHRPHHHARPHQHRLRRREDDHEQRRLGAHGHRPRQRRGPGRQPPPAPPSPARCSRPPSRAPAASCSPSPAAVDLGLFEVNEAAEVIHGVAHPDANIIFGTVIDDEHGRRGAGHRHRRRLRPLGRRRASRRRAGRRRRTPPSVAPVKDLFGKEDEDPLEGDDDFDVPSFLK